MTIQAAHGIITVAAQFDASHIGQGHQPAVEFATHDDLAEFLRRRESRLGCGCGVQLLALFSRQPTHLAGRDLYVLRLDGGLNVSRRQLQAVQLVGIEPDAHGVLKQPKVWTDPTPSTRERGSWKLLTIKSAISKLL